MYGGNAFNVSVFGVFVFGLVFVLNVFDVLYVFAFDRFYVIVWQDRHVRDVWWQCIQCIWWQKMFSVHNKTSIASNSSENVTALGQ